MLKMLNKKFRSVKEMGLSILETFIKPNPKIPGSITSI